MSWKKLGMEFGLQPVVAARDERLSLVQRFEYSVENREGLQFVTFDGELADLSRPFYSRTRNLGPGRCEGIRVCFCRAQVSAVLRSWRRGGSVGERCARPSAVARRFLPPCRVKTLEIGYH